MKALHLVAFILLIVGGLNWLLIGVIDLNLVEWLLGSLGDVVVRAVYVLVGLSAILELVSHKKSCKNCSAGGSMGSSAPSSM